MGSAQHFEATPSSAGIKLPDSVQEDDRAQWEVPPAAVRILVADDDQPARTALGALLAQEGYETVTAADGAAALALAKVRLPDLVISDVNMPGMDGIELCEKLHELDPDLPVIFTTEVDRSRAGSASLRAGAEDYISKPIHFDTLLWSVHRALERRANNREREQLRARTEQLCEELSTVNAALVTSSLYQNELAAAEAEQRAKLNALLERLSDGVIIADEGGRIQMINGAAYAILGAAPESVGCLDTLDAMGAQGVDGKPLRSDERPLRRALRGEDFVDYEVLRVRPDGDRRRVLSSGRSVKDADGAVVSAILVFRDVTELRRLEQQREEFTALITHDLRTPLSTIVLTTQLLRSSLEQKGPARNLQRIAQSAARMTTMIEELTEATSLEAHGVELRRVPCDLRELVTELLGSMDEVRARRIRIEAEEGPFAILADPNRLGRAVSNLLTNALKYSAEDAPVTVRLERRGSQVALDVADRGIGIASDDLKHLFDRYYRTIAGKARAEGLGLGLYITRLIVEAHGGRIALASEVGNGSTFTITLPFSTGVAVRQSKS